MSAELKEAIARLKKRVLTSKKSECFYAALF
jgi:hypothetical protein